VPRASQLGGKINARNETFADACATMNTASDGTLSADAITKLPADRRHAARNVIHKMMMQKDRPLVFFAYRRCGPLLALRGVRP
jgi:hypothetical protein